MGITIRTYTQAHICTHTYISWWNYSGLDSPVTTDLLESKNIIVFSTHFVWMLSIISISELAPYLIVYTQKNTNKPATNHINEPMNIYCSNGGMHHLDQPLPPTGNILSKLYLFHKDFVFTQLEIHTYASVLRSYINTLIQDFSCN